MSASRLASETAPRLDNLLRFRADIDALYEQETGEERVTALSHSIVVGLLLYNVYNVTSVFLLPDILALSVALRLLLVTPTSLALIWLIRQVSPAQRELLVMFGMINAIALPIGFFWYSQAPLAAYTFGELSLSLVFGNMLLLLRFRYALIFTVTAFGFVVLAIILKNGLGPELTAAFLVQFGTGCLFSIYANRRTEQARCRSYLAELDARAEAEEANHWRKRFEDLSFTDALTGLPNRRALQHRLDAWFSDARPMTLLMVDIDHFKFYNDRLGHPAGDDCLRRVASCLSETAARAGAFAARFGGEEFAIVQHNGSELQSARLALTIVDAVRRLEIAHPGRPDGVPVVTASIGVARVHSGLGSSPTALFEAADAALYLAKKRGRNQWVRSGEEADGLASSA
jgi:diguanylate cyclase (GGDEF)-like protein